MRTSHIRACAWLHKWSSLVCTLFMLLLGLTGLPLIFHHEIGHLLGTEIEAPPLPSSGTHVSAPRITLDEALASAQRRFPQLAPLFVSPDEEAGDTWRMTLADPGRPGAGRAGFTLAVVDARTGAFLGAPPLASGFMWVMHRLHEDLFAGLPGKLFLGGMGLLLVLALVSGAVLYAPFMRKLPFGQVRRRPRQPRLKWLDLHNLLGIVTLVWFLVVGATGAINTLTDVLVRLWQREALGAVLVHGAPPLPAAQRVPVQAAYQAAQRAARQAGVGGRMYFMALPGSPYAGARHYAFFMQGNTPLTARLPQAVLVDAGSGQVSAVPQAPWYLTLLLMSRPLHFGDYGGMPMKLLWAALDVLTLIVLGSGLYLWLKKGRPARPLPRPKPAAMPDTRPSTRPGPCAPKPALAPPAVPTPAPRFWPLWGGPLLMAALSSLGLVAALFSEGGWGDALAALCLCAPVAACLWFGWLRRA